MSILIKGMEMPMERGSFTLTIKYNGMVLDTETGIQVAEAHELPPHGRLIDADALKQNTYEIYDPLGIIEAVPVDVIDNAQTVFEAEEGET